MISRNLGLVKLAACTAIGVALWIVGSVPFAAAQSSWQAEWENTRRAAEAEGAVYPVRLLLRLRPRAGSIQEKIPQDQTEHRRCRRRQFAGIPHPGRTAR